MAKELFEKAFEAITPGDWERACAILRQVDYTHEFSLRVCEPLAAFQQVVCALDAQWSWKCTPDGIYTVSIIPFGRPAIKAVSRSAARCVDMLLMYLTRAEGEPTPPEGAGVFVN